MLSVKIAAALECKIRQYFGITVSKVQINRGVFRGWGLRLLPPPLEVEKMCTKI